VGKSPDHDAAGTANALAAVAVEGDRSLAALHQLKIQQIERLEQRPVRWQILQQVTLEMTLGVSIALTPNAECEFHR
jgi:hypothetical protein